MNTSVIGDTDILTMGGGPTSLVLALWRTRPGVRVRIVDERRSRGPHLWRLQVQARTLEQYSQMGLSHAVVERRDEAGAANLWVGDK
jgi:2-polyprenyl-6-methoxyphenol hydroxylase-like FAD-dependent oxidoreductase